jgi:hypothetical protein
MNVFLPIRVYDKCINCLFKIEINNDLLSVYPENNDNQLYQIILCSSIYGINTLPIIFPLNFIILNNDLISDLFYIFHILSSANELDFIYNLIQSINLKYDKNYKLYNNFNLSTLINILKFHNTNDNNINDSDTLNSILYKIFYRTNKYINFCTSIMINENNINIAQSSKILQIINSIKLLKTNFYGNTLSVEEHIEHINNPSLIKKRRTYFYETENKIIKINSGDIIKKDNIKIYPTKYKNHILIKNLLNHLIIEQYKNIFECTCKVLYKKKLIYYSIIINYLFNNNKDYNIDYDIYINSTINYKYIAYDCSYLKFKNMIISNEITFNTELLDELLNAYSYPINYDKRTLTEQFAKILLYCFTFHNSIDNLNTSHRIKNIILFLINFYKVLSETNIINTNRIYTDILLYQIIKILLFNDTYEILNKIKNIDIIRQIFIDNVVVLYILNNISWKTLPKQLIVFKHIIQMKDICKDLIMNKQYIQDNRLKKVLLDPIIMFNYLKYEDDFYKWIINIKEYIYKIFTNMITLDNSDYKKLSKILYNYSKIKNQNMNDENYKKIICLLKKNNRLILFNDRINIKFKEIFKNININLGFLARDIANEENASVSITDDVDDTIISSLKKKYYKYKGKYLEIKYSELSNNN